MKIFDFFYKYRLKLQTKQANWVLSVLFVILFALFIPIPHIKPDVNNQNSEIPLKISNKNNEETFLPHKNPESNIEIKNIYNKLHKNYPIILYQAQQTENIADISKKFNVNEKTILENNKKQIKYGFVQKGTYLIIPKFNGVFKKWQFGETWESIASSYQVPIAMLIGWNNQYAGKKSFEMVNEYIFVPYSENQYRKPNPTYPYTNCFVENLVVGDMNMIWPTTTRVLSGDTFNLSPETFHAGIDIGTFIGTPVFAVDDGNVVFSGENDLYGYYIVIDHNNGWVSLYAHLDKMIVFCGQEIYKGEIIGYSGNTGKSSGPHLHFGLKYNGQWENPLDFLQ